MQALALYTPRTRFIIPNESHFQHISHHATILGRDSNQMQSLQVRKWIPISSCTIHARCGSLYGSLQVKVCVWLRWCQSSRQTAWVDYSQVLARGTVVRHIKQTAGSLEWPGPPALQLQLFGMGFSTATSLNCQLLKGYRALQISKNAPNVAKWCRQKGVLHAFSYDQKHVDPQIRTRESPA